MGRFPQRKLVGNGTLELGRGEAWRSCRTYQMNDLNWEGLRRIVLEMYWQFNDASGRCNLESGGQARAVVCTRQNPLIAQSFTV